MFTTDQIDIIFETKKILEFWEADSEFRDSLDNGTYDPFKYNFRIDPRSLSFLINQNRSSTKQLKDINSGSSYKPPSNCDEPTKLFSKLLSLRHQMREVVEDESHPVNSHFYNWRRSQINRLKTSFSPEAQS